MSSQARPVGIHDPDGSITVIGLVGGWEAFGDSASMLVGNMEVVKLPVPRHRRRWVRGRRLAWWLVGEEYDDDAVDKLLCPPAPGVESPRLAMLGNRHDWTRCERWLRRGCEVYLEGGSPVSRVLTALHVAASCSLIISDNCFLTEFRARALKPLETPLTRREIDVVRLLSSGISNRGIAAQLSLSEHTIEFHVTNILGKLGVRSRGEAGEYARITGI